MTPAERHEVKLRELVEQAGFVLAVSMDVPARFRIVEVINNEWSTVAWAATTAHGFDVVFPSTQVRAATPMGMTRSDVMVSRASIALADEVSSTSTGAMARILPRLASSAARAVSRP